MKNNKIIRSKLLPDLPTKFHLFSVAEVAIILGTSTKSAICAGTEKGRQRLSGDCKLDNISGLATDLEALIDAKYKTVNHTSSLWVERWEAG